MGEELTCVCGDKDMVHSGMKRRASITKKRAILAPAVTTISEGLYSMEFSFKSFSARACLNSGRPAEGAYFVLPSFKAFIQASFIKSGVSKSGSPAPKPIISTP